MTYRRDNAIVARRIGDETVLVPVRQNVGDLECIFTLNATGALLWEKLDGAQSVESLAGAVAEEFEVAPAQAEADARAFLEQMSELHLVEEITYA